MVKIESVVVQVPVQTTRDVPAVRITMTCDIAQQLRNLLAHVGSGKHDLFALSGQLTANGINFEPTRDPFEGHVGMKSARG